MDLATITAICIELESELTGRRFGKIFQLSKTDIAVDFRLLDSRHLFVSVEPGNPRIYLMKRRLRDLEKVSGTPATFSLILRKQLSGAELSSVTQIDGERVLLFGFIAEDDLGATVDRTLAVQLTGASANLFLLDSERRIMDSARQTLGRGQQIGEIYEPPERRVESSR